MNREPTAHLTDAQRLRILKEVCSAAREGRPAVTSWLIDLPPVLRSFRYDQTLDAESSLALGFEHFASRSELATTAAARLGIQLYTPAPTLDDVIEGELSTLGVSR